MYLTPLSFQLGSKKIDVKRELENHGAFNNRSYEKAGFKFVYHCDVDEDLISLASLAIKKIPNLDVLDVDALIAVSSLYENSPHWAQELNSTIPNPGKRKIYALQDACTGYLSAINLATSLITSGDIKSAIIATGDTYSRYFNNQYSVSLLFSDSFSLSLITSEKKISSDFHYSINFDPIATEHVNQSAPKGSLNISSGLLEMNGAKVFQFVIREVPSAIESILSRTNISVSQIDWIVHQGSRIVVNELEKILNLDENFLFNASDYGNTVGNSIPIQLFAQRPSKPYVGLVSFGMGLVVNITIGKWKV